MQSLSNLGFSAIALLVCIAGMGCSQAFAQSPRETVVENKAKQAMQHRRGPKQYQINSAEGASITLWKPDLQKRQLNEKMGVITVPPTGVDNYHAVVLEKDWGDEVEVVIRYVYMQGKPSGQSPKKLLAAKKAEHEVVPLPLPREHHRYYAATSWSFLVRQSGIPLVGHIGHFATQNGSLLKAITDKNGEVTFPFPDDFKAVVEGLRERKSAGFDVFSEFEDGGINYQTTLTGDYYLPASHWESTKWGLLVATVGFMFGGLIILVSGRLKSGNRNATV